MQAADVIYRFSNSALIGIIVLAAIGASIVIPLVGSRLLRQEEGSARAGFALDAFKLIGPVIAIFTAFTLLQAINRYRDAETLVAREATEFTQFDRTLRRLDPAVATPIRRALADYGRSVVADEWPAQKNGVRSPATDRLFADLTEQIHALHRRPDVDPLTREAIDEGVDQLIDARDLRLSAAHTGLPAIFWQVLGGLVLLLVAEAFLFRFAWDLVVPKAGYAAAIGLLIGLLVVLDYPFRGQQSVDAEPIRRALAVMARN